MTRAFVAIAALALSACGNQGAASPEFVVVDAPGANSSFLLEKHSGCVLALVVEGNDRQPNMTTEANKATGKTEQTISAADFQRYIEESDQALEDSKKYGRFQLLDVKSAKTDSCRNEFAMTRPPQEKAQ